jgi:hypothetical protein
MTHLTSPKTAGSRRVAVVTGGGGPAAAAGRRGYRPQARRHRRVG